MIKIVVFFVDLTQKNNKVAEAAAAAREKKEQERGEAEAEVSGGEEEINDEITTESPTETCD